MNIVSGDRQDVSVPGSCPRGLLGRVCLSQRFGVRLLSVPGGLREVVFCPRGLECGCCLS